MKRNFVNIMNRYKYLKLAEEILNGQSPEKGEYLDILNSPDQDIIAVMNGADLIRNRFFGNEVHLCTICNGKSGRCSEDCRFCSQSSFAKTDSPAYPLMDRQGLMEGGLRALDTPINRYSIVTTGRGLSKKETKIIADAMYGIDSEKLGKCASLGILDEDDMKILKNAGVNRYHHNLETCRSHFENICTTHTWEERLNTIRAAKKTGMEVCAGGIFGVGESNEQILELAVELRTLDVDSVPINFLTTIKGTPFENLDNLSPLRCLKIIAFFRYLLPDKDILVCGGREQNLREMHSMVFHAGASGIMTGNYLTTEGRTLELDLEMIRGLGFKVRA